MDFGRKDIEGWHPIYEITNHPNVWNHQAVKDVGIRRNLLGSSIEFAARWLIFLLMGCPTSASAWFLVATCGWNAEMQFYLSCFHFMMSVYGCFFSSQHPHVSCWVLSWFSHRPWHSRGCFTPNVRRLCVIGGLWQPICVEHLWLRKQNTLMVIKNIDVLFSVIKKNRIKSPVNSLMVIPSWCFLVLHPSPAVVPCWMTPSYAVFYSSTPTQVTANRKNAIKKNWSVNIPMNIRI